VPFKISNKYLIKAIVPSNYELFYPLLSGEEKQKVFDETFQGNKEGPAALLPFLK
jgi:hypothetical protein